MLLLSDAASRLTGVPPIHEKNRTVFNTAARRTRAHKLSDGSNKERARTNAGVYIHHHIKSVATSYLGRDISPTMNHTNCVSEL